MTLRELQLSIEEAVKVDPGILDRAVVVLRHKENRQRKVKWKQHDTSASGRQSVVRNGPVFFTIHVETYKGVEF